MARRILWSPLVILPPALLYGALVLPRLAEVFTAVSSPTLAGIAALLGTPAGATIAWAHFLAFDLFVGRWIYLDRRERGISALLIAPVLFLTLMLGPLGFLLYLVLRDAAARSFGVEPHPNRPKGALMMGDLPWRSSPMTRPEGSTAEGSPLR